MPNTTDQIRTRFVTATRFESGHRFTKMFAADFDAWLAAHDAEVRTEERDKAAQRVSEIPLHRDTWVVADHDWDVSVMLSDAIAAARGDGEQA